MSTPILICAAISVLLLLIILVVIAYRLGVIADYTFDIIHADLIGLREKMELRELRELRELEKGAKPGKQREYWRDQNGLHHWRKTNNQLPTG